MALYHYISLHFINFIVRQAAIGQKEPGYGQNPDIGSPVPIFIFISKRGSGNLATDTDVLKRVMHTQQEGRDVTKALARGQLYKKEAMILIDSDKQLNLMISIITLYTALKLMKQ